MTRECTQFIMSIDEIKAMGPAYLESYSSLMLPEMQFRFITFVADDYRRRRVTCFLYNYVPDSVFFSIENPLELESALDQLIGLNPGVEWYLATLNYFDWNESGHARIQVELSLSEIPMRVHPNGALICK